MAGKSSVSASAPAKSYLSHPEPQRGDPCAMVIFGAAGDLTKRLVIPALYNMMCAGRLPDGFALIGVDRAEGTAQSWATHLHAMLEQFVGNASAEFDPPSIDETVWAKLAGKMVYIQGDMTTPALYGRIGAALAAAQKKKGTGGNALFYLAVPDRFFGTVVEELGKARLADEKKGSDGKEKVWRRVVIEKPFGQGPQRAYPESA